MKRVLMIAVILFSVLTGTAQKGTLKIIISDIESNKGTIKVALYNIAGKKSFLKDSEHAYAKKAVAIKNKTAVIIFTNIPYGTYAVSLFQDINNNDSLDRAVVGFPTEPYGISGNKNTIGPPSFDDGKFEFKTLNMILKIRLKTYLKKSVD